MTRQFSTMMLAAGLLITGNAMACNDGNYPSMLGSVCLMAATYCPVGYVAADDLPPFRH